MKNSLSTKISESINGIQTFFLVAAFSVAAWQAYKSTKALEQQEYGSLIQQQQEIFSLQIDNSDVYVKSLREPEKLTPSELWKVTEIIYLRIELLERFRRAYNNGIIPLDDLSDEYSDANIYLGTPIGRLVWHSAREDYKDDPEFVSAIDNAIEGKDVVAPDHIFFNDLYHNFREIFGEKPITQIEHAQSGT
ncbi:MAG: hypothetical protein E6R11_04235 [Rhodocyclaceae bacterium]|nr:MAG: hypothetical protein EYC71_07575 [Gammaproteobacteria bacterium]TXG78764.1 MAG: hypothetical protein E6R11_04235 [Rhodocyclaceae bacterium]